MAKKTLEELFQLGAIDGWVVSGGFGLNALCETACDDRKRRPVNGFRGRRQLRDDVFAATPGFDHREYAVELTPGTT